MASGDHDRPTDVSPRRQPHVAVLTFPFGNHVPPLYALARSLAAAAPSVAFSFFSSARSNAALSAATPPNLRLHDVPDGCPEGFVPDPRRPVEGIEMFLAAAQGNFREAMASAAVESAGGAGISCVVSDSFLWFAAELAAEMGDGVPWVPLWNSGTSCLSAHLYTDEIRRRIGVGDKAKPDEALDFIPGLSKALVRDLPEGIVSGDLDSLFARLLHKMGQVLPSASTLALGTFEGLEPPILADLKAKFQRCLPVGPLHLFPPASPASSSAGSDVSDGCLQWLDRQSPLTVVYVGFGTVATPSPPELAALAEGLEAAGAPFLWSLRDAARQLLPPGFADRTAGRGLIVPWAPQARVLGHPAVGVFVTHCGWNSVLESIQEGVPMVCRPFFGDQVMNGRWVTHVWEVGVGVEGGVLTKDGMVRALDVVQRTEEGKGMRERVGRLKKLARSAVGPGGSSTENIGTLAEIVCCING